MDTDSKPPKNKLGSLEWVRMRQRRSLRFAHVCVLALAICAEPALAQAGWPSLGDLHERGQHLDEAALERILSRNTFVLGPGPGATGTGATVTGAIFRCNGPNTPILFFDAASSGFDMGTCRVEGSAVCLEMPALEREVCREIRQIAEYGRALFGFDKTRIEGGGTDAGRSARTAPAMATALVPEGVYGLAAASGEIDLGGMTVTLPSKHRFALVHASSFPLRVVYQGAIDYETTVLYLERLGWPDRHRQPMSALPVPLQRQPQVDFLANWERGYARRDLFEWGYDEGAELSAYQSRAMEVDGSPCIRTHETVTAGQPENDTAPPPVLEHRSQQLCISLEKGAFVGVTVEFVAPEMDGKSAREHAEAIFSTVRLSPGTEIDWRTQTTLAGFDALQGGDPELTWEMLDCVQGWNRTAQINGCNHSIRRYSELIAAGEQLLAGDRLSDAERETVQETLLSSRATLAIVHVVRAHLLEEEAPAQTRADCAAALRIAREIGDSDLAETVADCP